MSSEDDTAAALWQELGGNPDDLKQNGNADRVLVSREEFESLLEDVRDLQTRVSQLESDDDREYTSKLVEYQHLPPNRREELLTASEHRAVTLWEHWDKLAQPINDGAEGITTKRNSTKKYAPSQFKLDLENILGEDLEWQQIYRAMKRAAILSGGSTEHTEYGKTHITGGYLEYHERTSPDNTDHTTYRVLLEQS